MTGRIEQLTERIGQLDQEITGLTAQYASKKEQTTLVREELDNLKQLLKQGLVQANRVFALDRERARLEGEEGELIAQIASDQGPDQRDQTADHPARRRCPHQDH